MLTKIKRIPFTKVERRFKVLDLIHSDACDLHVTPTLGGNKYSVTFINYFCRCCHVYLIQLKGEVMSKFKIYKSEVEFYHETSVKCSSLIEVENIMILTI